MFINCIFPSFEGCILKAASSGGGGLLSSSNTDIPVKTLLMSRILMFIFLSIKKTDVFLYEVKFRHYGAQQGNEKRYKYIAPVAYSGVVDIPVRI